MKHLIFAAIIATAIGCDQNPSSGSALGGANNPLAFSTERFTFLTFGYEPTNLSEGRDQGIYFFQMNLSAWWLATLQFRFRTDGSLHPRSSESCTLFSAGGSTFTSPSENSQLESPEVYYCIYTGPNTGINEIPARYFTFRSPSRPTWTAQIDVPSIDPSEWPVDIISRVTNVASSFYYIIPTPPPPSARPLSDSNGVVAR